MVWQDCESGSQFGSFCISWKAAYASARLCWRSNPEIRHVFTTTVGLMPYTSSIVFTNCAAFSLCPHFPCLHKSGHGVNGRL